MFTIDTTKDLSVTSVEQWRDQACPIETIPDAEGKLDPGLKVRLRRVGLLDVVGAKALPNHLLAVVKEVFEGKRPEVPQLATEIEQWPETVAVLDHVIRLALVEPSMAELEAAGIRLTDLQRSAIIKFAFQGPQGLEFFRTWLRDVQARADSPPVEPPAEQLDAGTDKPSGVSPG